ncbi:MAG: aminoacyl-tRNA hydrolase [Deltaproteobacteria bacterium]|jgi:PTH1 family peptidyl-tRNA hydrolase|nr:aminoacyl-tRNA hydrolase [Deltaproteobacteria bacterium]MBW2535444.1 aminoacyl-tRNA hydrolase [Deltaproteobacteria bacterium]
MLLVVGLGNPGAGYAEDRHNVGFQVLDELTRHAGAEPWRTKFSGEICRLRLDGDDLLLLKPQTYMNRSGDSVQPAAAFYRIPARDVVVIHDEVDLPVGTVRLKHGGGLAGHKGLKSIAARLATQDFGRVRIGVGRPPEGFRGEMADYVLSPFAPEDRPALPTILKIARESVLDIAARGFAAAMKTRNTRPSKKRRRPPDDPEGSETAEEATGRSKPTGPSEAT